MGPFSWNIRFSLRFVRTLVVCGLFVAVPSMPAQSAGGSASVTGCVRDLRGNPVPDAAVRLQPKDANQAATVRTDAQGKYRFASLREGVYVLTAGMSGHKDVQIPSLFVGPAEVKTVDLTLGPVTDSGGAAAISQPQFFDEPQFTVAGVTDATNLGGHGSDTIVRAREKLAKDTVSLGKSDASPASVASETSLREDVAHQPSSFDANHRLGHFLLLTGRSPEGMTYLERAGKIAPGDYENDYDLAAANAATGNYVVARESVIRLIARDEKPELHHLLGDIEEKLGDPLDAVRQYQRAAEMDAKEGYFFDWGAELLLHHAPEPALEVFTKANHLYPRSLRILIGLGAASFSQGSYDEAIRRICEASDLNPEDPSPYLFLGKMLRAEASPSVAVVEKLHRFVTLRPDDAQANYYYAVALGQLHKGQASEEVESHLTKAIKLDPGLAPADLQLGILHSEKGTFSAAISDYQRALHLDPQMGEAHYRLAQAYRQTGEAEKAKEELRLYRECTKESEQEAESERHEIRQFVYTLRDQAAPR